MRYNDGHSSSGHGWTAKLVDLSRVLSLGATAQSLNLSVCVCVCSCVYRLPASVIQDHLVELDYYCRVGWVGWREVAVSVDSLVYRSSAGGSWRRGRARRNAALQRHVHEALMQKAILAVVVGRRRKGAIAVSRRRNV